MLEHHGCSLLLMGVDNDNISSSSSSLTLLMQMMDGTLRKDTSCGRTIIGGSKPRGMLTIDYNISYERVHPSVVVVA